MKFPRFKIKGTKRGFTLIETLVAIAIVDIALVAATAALQNSLQTSTYVKNQITAYYLAEDAMEYVVAQRDAGAATSAGWMSQLLPCVGTAATQGSGLECGVDTFSNEIENYTPTGSLAADSLGTTSVPVVGNVPALSLCQEPDGNSGTISVFEQFPSGTGCKPTAFTRTVTITPVQCLDSSSCNGDVGDGTNAYNEAVVTVKVSWGTGPFTNNNASYTLSDDLYNWQPSDLADQSSTGGGGSPPSLPPDSASFAGIDTTTQGAWTNVYGSSGYNIADPSGWDVSGPLTSGLGTTPTTVLTGATGYTWGDSLCPAADPRVLAVPPGDTQTGECLNEPTWYSYYSDTIPSGWGPFYITVDLPDSNTHQVALYLVDYDHNGRSETIQVYNADPDSANDGALLDTETIPAGANFVNGVYYKWNIAGDVKFLINTDVSGYNAVVSGIFFD